MPIRSFLRFAGVLVFGAVLVPGPARAFNLFGLVDTGELFASADGGVTWQARSALPVRDAAGLVAGASASELYLVATSGSVYRSMDAGVNWTAIAAVPASDVVALVPLPGRFLLVCRRGDVFASLDGGATFTPLAAIVASDLVAAAPLGGSVFALSASGIVHRSDDQGATWDEVGAITVSNAVALAAHLGRLLALTSTGDIARSDDFGATWAFVGTLSQSGMTALFSAPDALLATTSAGEVAASGNGAAWTWRGTINQLHVRALASDQPHPTSVGMGEAQGIAFLGPRPNPVRGEVAMLAFELEREALVTVSVHDLAGRELARPIRQERMGPGRVERRWSIRGLPTGLHLVLARMGDRSEVRRVVVLGP